MYGLKLKWWAPQTDGIKTQFFFEKGDKKVGF
jgi:hypothetical protein